jgi:allophanate hydrolase subunit 1
LRARWARRGESSEVPLIHKPGDGVWFVAMEENHFVEPQTTR